MYDQLIQTGQFWRTNRILNIRIKPRVGGAPWPELAPPNPTTRQKKVDFAAQNIEFCEFHL